MKTIRLTTAQAIVRYLAAQKVVIDGHEHALFGGVFAIFGHGNVAGMGEALSHAREFLPTLRAHNEQAMAHAAIAYAKAHRRRRMMACTTSIGPGATNLITAAALAHVNRLPVLFLPGDTFANRRPDPVLQQLENPNDPTITVNDCLRPVSRYFDRIVRPEQLHMALPAALATLLDPVTAGPVTLALPQDVQTEAGNFDLRLFEARIHSLAAPTPQADEVQRAAAIISRARRPLIIAGGGVHYAAACGALAQFATTHQIPVAETQAGKGVLAWQHAMAMGGIGVTGSQVANDLAGKADVIIAIGTRLGDFFTGSRTLFAPEVQLIAINVARFDAQKHGATALVGDAKVCLLKLGEAVAGYRSEGAWSDSCAASVTQWQAQVDEATRAPALPQKRCTDAQIVGAINRFASSDSVVVCAAGGMPGELHKLWRSANPESYHVEYGYSCMGYEIAGGLGVKLAQPHKEVIVVVGDGSYLMMNSEIATAVAMGMKLIIVVVDNRGFACIDRLQRSLGGVSFNNLLDDAAPLIDFANHAAALGAASEKVAGIAELEQALVRARDSKRTFVISIEADPRHTTTAGGTFWDVPVAEVSADPRVTQARLNYEKTIQRLTAHGDEE